MAKTPTTTEDLIERIQQEAMAVAGPDPSRVQTILTETLAQPGDWLDACYQELGDGDYALYPLYRAENCRCSILSVVIRPGIPVPIHNHGSWAVIGIYKGRERETWFRRVDDGSVPGRAELEVEERFLHEKGTVNLVPDGKIHTVEALDSIQAVSIHIYGTDIITQERSTFDLQTGTEEIFHPAFVTSTAERRM
jgi:predicted metal-dependent enzyme (double-stranded beta helix superfamily)